MGLLKMHSLPVRFDDEGDTRTKDNGLESSSMDECGWLQWPEQDDDGNRDELPEPFCERSRGEGSLLLQDVRSLRENNYKLV